MIAINKTKFLVGISSVFVGLVLLSLFLLFSILFNNVKGNFDNNYSNQKELTRIVGYLKDRDASQDVTVANITTNLANTQTTLTERIRGNGEAIHDMVARNADQQTEINALKLANMKLKERLDIFEKKKADAIAIYMALIKRQDEVEEGDLPTIIHENELWIYKANKLLPTLVSRDKVLMGYITRLNEEVEKHRTELMEARQDIAKLKGKKHD